MQVSIRTTQNVFIDQDKAGVGHRILAMLIDLTIMIMASVGIGALLTLTTFDAVWIQTLFYFPIFFYHLYMEILNNGQSVGKMVVGIKVVRLDGTPPTIGGYIMRWILSPLDLMLSGSVAIISIGLTEHGQRLGDLAAGTTVIKLKRTKNVSRLQLVEKMDEDYEPQFPEVKALSDTDVALIKECLQVKAKHANLTPVQLVAAKVKETLNIESELQPVAFLYTILRDHTYYTTR
ncbi:MAG: RDD family protein [Roseivirga sp.]|nr:RDD family protein [Roseivirga sp.]